MACKEKLPCSKGSTRKKVKTSGDDLRPIQRSSTNSLLPRRNYCEDIEDNVEDNNVKWLPQKFTVNPNLLMILLSSYSGFRNLFKRKK